MDGRLQNSINKLKQHATGKWTKGNDGMMHAKKEPSISSQMVRGQVGRSDYLNLRLSADIQNYKNEFVPSLSLGFAIVTNRNSLKREYSFMGESHFTFAKDDKGVLQTYRNTFITVGYSQTSTLKDKTGIDFAPAFSLGYLIRQRGDVYEKNTFRFGFAKVMIFGGRVKLEPIVYFNNFFKGVTPGIRLSL
jgi:hypothetical protein